MCSRPISHVTQLSGGSQARTSAYQRIPAHSTIMGVSTKRPPRPAGLNYAAIFGIGTPALRRSGTVGGAVAPSVPLPGVPLRHVAAVLLLSIGLVAATMLLFHTFPVLVGLLYIGPDGAPECTADPSVASAAPPAVSYACSCIAPVSVPMRIRTCVGTCCCTLQQHTQRSVRGAHHHPSGRWCCWCCCCCCCGLMARKATPQTQAGSSNIDYMCWVCLEFLLMHLYSQLTTTNRPSGAGTCSGFVVWKCC